MFLKLFYLEISKSFRYIRKKGLVIVITWCIEKANSVDYSLFLV